MGREEGNSNEPYQGNFQPWDYVIQLGYAFAGKDTSWYVFPFLRKSFVSNYFSYNTEVYSLAHVGSPFTF